ncbi:MAG: 4-(cytidine 5'-diphospho)-2-C-methyl-D-erythritol kinase [Bacteroidales bacterium]|jgi:4-diphosphocytidyl-2-C-methyl-D-erythritol kinase|nr:4-(cytidine 5'-diphospho)-2-C-methyl-D-erythritol kinase [Bacteroidales bacterium]
MIRFPNCKINIGLFVTEKRADSYHNIETIFYPVAIEDALEIVISQSKKTSLHISGIPIYGDSETNLVMRAYRLLETDFQLPPVDIYLHKKIPYGAGLGGGSSDATQTLLILNELFNLNLSQSQLLAYAIQIGADCPFFLKNRPLFAYEKGSLFKEIELNLDSYWLALIKPPYAINTQEAYSKINPKKLEYSLQEIVKQPIELWKEFVFNDFESFVFHKYPLIQRIKELMYHNGALYASMSGSGSAVYGIFKETPFFQYFADCIGFVLPPKV